jgi:hypothetical protein
VSMVREFLAVLRLPAVPCSIRRLRTLRSNWFLAVMVPKRAAREEEALEEDDDAGVVVCSYFCVDPPEPIGCLIVWEGGKA